MLTSHRGLVKCLWCTAFLMSTVYALGTPMPMQRQLIELRAEHVHYVRRTATSLLEDQQPKQSSKRQHMSTHVHKSTTQGYVCRKSIGGAPIWRLFCSVLHFAAEAQMSSARHERKPAFRRASLLCKLQWPAVQQSATATLKVLPMVAVHLNVWHWNNPILGNGLTFGPRIQALRLWWIEAIRQWWMVAMRLHHYFN